MTTNVPINDFLSISKVEQLSFLEDPITNTYFELYNLLPMNDEKRRYDELRIGKNLSKTMLEVKGGYYERYLWLKKKYLEIKKNRII